MEKPLIMNEHCQKGSTPFFMKTGNEWLATFLSLWEPVKLTQTHSAAMVKYFTDFYIPFTIALNSFLAREQEKASLTRLPETIMDYYELLQFNLQVAERGFWGSLLAMNKFHQQKTVETLD